jgi:hypothetical protein
LKGLQIEFVRDHDLQMSSSADVISTAEAAALLGVTVQQVRRLANAGELSKVARGLVERASVDRYRVERRGGRTRVWSENVAWSAIAMLSGVSADWTSPSQASRVRTALRTMDDPRELVIRTRGRATIHTYAGYTAAATRLRELVANPGSPAPRRITTQADHLDGYLAADALGRLEVELGLRRDSVGSITLRATSFNTDVIHQLSVAGTVLAALDMATSRVPSERRVSERILAFELEDYSC